MIVFEIICGVILFIFGFVCGRNSVIEEVLKEALDSVKNNNK